MPVFMPNSFILQMREEVGSRYRCLYAIHLEERYSLTDQMHRSDTPNLATASLSRSICANLAI
jgi:hypothetical protein